jgi:DNA-binding transcriptional LysR family regulator
MGRKRIDWEKQIGRRLKLRDLQVFFTVVQHGSMAQAAAELEVSQPAISEIIADLEHTVGVRLFDRSPKGVEPTIYGHTLLKRGLAAFDELRQGIRDIEFLADPTAGEVRIGCVESIASVILPPVVEKFSTKYPRTVLHVQQLVASNLELRELRERRLDLVLARVMRPLENDADDLNVEVLFDDHLVIVAGANSKWARRRKVDLAELLDEPWVMTPSGSWTYLMVEEIFRARNLKMPNSRLVTFAVNLRANLLAAAPFIAPLPRSMLLNLNPNLFTVLPISLPDRRWPVVIVTLKNRTLSSTAQVFIEHLRACANSMVQELKP